MYNPSERGSGLIETVNYNELMRLEMETFHMFTDEEKRVIRDRRKHLLEKIMQWPEIWCSIDPNTREKVDQTIMKNGVISVGIAIFWHHLR
jgi:hypothetical protein